MKVRKLMMSAALMAVLPLAAQKESQVRLFPDQAKQSIPKEIYGQFAEHLGTCIYGGLWVGENSAIPNTDGYRNDVLQALKDLKIPVLRWPGGCFADEYHWMDGIGPKENRPRMVNNNWGGTVEDNSFGTHEFLNLCELLECEPYVSMNVGSGTVQETAQWVEYMTAEDGPMAKLRKQNGREKPWRVKYIGVGNESWGCGGNMRPEYYADLYRRYQTYCRNYDGNRLFKIASGSGEYDLHWTETMMKQARNQMDGLSLHYYTVAGWSGSKGSATDFTPEDYYWTMGKCLDIENCIKEHSAVMDKYDPKKRVALMVDEWGTWWDEEPGTIRGHLYQQNTMRDAFVAALSLNVFHKCENKQVRARMGQDGEQRTLPMLGATASKAQDGAVHISLSNVDLENSNEVTVDLSGLGMKSVAGRILTCKAITDKNTFEQPDVVKPADFKGAKLKNGKLAVKMPPMSIVALELR